MCDKAKALRRYRVQYQPFEETDECFHMQAISAELRRQSFCLESEGTLQEDMDVVEEGSRCLVGYGKRVETLLEPSHSLHVSLSYHPNLLFSAL